MRLLIDVVRDASLVGEEKNAVTSSSEIGSVDSGRKGDRITYKHSIFNFHDEQILC